MKILFAGGGTLGPVTPLLAVKEAWEKIDRDIDWLWVGTKEGPERQLVEASGFRFFSIAMARLPRYPSIEWIALPFRFIAAFCQAFSIVRRNRPALVGVAGGFTGVPLAYAAWLLNVPVWVHQTDARPVLSNRICAQIASLITVAWEETSVAFTSKKTRVVGNPVRASLLAADRDQARKRFGFDASRPCVFVFGGGAGAAWMNQLFVKLAPELIQRANVVHVTGRGKIVLLAAHCGIGRLSCLAGDGRCLCGCGRCRLSRGIRTITESGFVKPAIVSDP